MALTSIKVTSNEKTSEVLGDWKEFINNFSKLRKFPDVNHIKLEGVYFLRKISIFEFNYIEFCMLCILTGNTGS
jgi:hypothetical protein